MGTNNGTNSTSTRRAAVYVRVSTDEQADHGYGLDVQRERCLAQVTAKGWTLVDVYQDAGVSGALPADQRPALARMLADIDAGIVDAVVVLALDRLGRKTRIVLDVTDRITDAGAELVSVKEAIDTTTAAGRLFRTMLAGIAEFERDTIIARTSAGREQRATRDGERGGQVPLGYRRADDGTVVLDPAGADLVRRVFALRAKGHTLQSIADTMNAAGIATPRGGRWYPSVVNSVLGNRGAYVGGQRGGSPVRWPRIIGPTDVARAIGRDCRTRGGHRIKVR